MKDNVRFLKVKQLLASPQLTVLCCGVLVADVANARLAMGMPDPSLLPIWGSAVVLGVVAYRLKKRK